MNKSFCSNNANITSENISEIVLQMVIKLSVQNVSYLNCKTTPLVLYSFEVQMKAV